MLKTEDDNNEIVKEKKETTEDEVKTITLPPKRQQKITLDDCFELGMKTNTICLSSKVSNIRNPLTWLCDCGNKYSESYYNIKYMNRGCLKCMYKKFSKRNCK